MDGLVDVPVVDVFIQHQYAQVIAGIQQELGAGVMGRADGVVAVLLQNTDLPPLGILIAAGPQHAVVVVDAGPLDDGAFAVEQKAAAPPRNGA